MGMKKISKSTCAWLLYALYQLGLDMVSRSQQDTTISCSCFAQSKPI